MRVTIDLDDGLIAEVMEITGLSSPEAAVEEALREFIRIHRQRRALEELRGTGWEGNLDEIRDSWSTDEA
ncbi:MULTISPECIES: type II toxin-antitoxin system VapB family antitoxin [unclassified Agrobacterium]|uniref:Antitoxin VapB n=1 Tax=Agrobacterium fabrum TaxID=1176649 RepID=A0A2W5GZ34_9HYPH|nr:MULTISPECIES: type II toxin-antitoxin system VapB family antitoxin [unclassified Agrobacterium]PZP51066.1 MAG: antitoxin VapB [Agrobacterium fabrum]MDH0615370.1 type II toxin-antitoxin system VapB family antitoxin [Agrobacterium sp. GD03872]MDH0698417.1 type II toxin-antitoxin system VapB family antitoxin [Agrobacterium sp. GD03871]MDH1060596.1 type II toxin-antitoxin system VapB family antitoxin [Agrobacterium sp. GD03992]MDH2213021.1 type II toxin-antitoxin system VapB family antitoxin [A